MNKQSGLNIAINLSPRHGYIYINWTGSKPTGASSIVLSCTLPVVIDIGYVNVHRLQLYYFICLSVGEILLNIFQMGTLIKTQFQLNLSHIFYME